MEQVNPHKILVVDDDEKNRQVMGLMLKHYGYGFETASDGAEALTKTRQYLPDLILLDVMMPEMDGYQVCQVLKADKQLRDIPVVMITALTDHDSRLKGLEAGADDFLTKPVDKNELKLRTRNLLRIKEFTEPSHFEPRIHEAFRDIHHEFKEIYETQHDA